MPSPFQDREFLYSSLTRRFENGTIHILNKSVQHPDFPENNKKYTRGQMVNGLMILKPVEGGTHMTYLYNAHPSGSIPKSLVNLTASKESFNVLKIKKMLQRMTKVI